LADFATEEFELDMTDSYRVMYVGFTFSGKLLEVGIECIDAPKNVFLHVYHAMPATSKYQMLFNRAKKR
jgi:hypothetical protein